MKKPLVIPVLDSQRRFIWLTSGSVCVHVAHQDHLFTKIIQKLSICNLETAYIVDPEEGSVY